MKIQAICLLLLYLDISATIVSKSWKFDTSFLLHFRLRGGSVSSKQIKHFRQKALAVIQSLGGKADIQLFELRWEEAFPGDNIIRKTILSFFFIFRKLMGFIYSSLKGTRNRMKLPLI